MSLFWVKPSTSPHSKDNTVKVMEKWWSRDKMHFWSNFKLFDFALLVQFYFDSGTKKDMHIRTILNWTKSVIKILSERMSADQNCNGMHPSFLFLRMQDTVSLLNWFQSQWKHDLYNFKTSCKQQQTVIKQFFVAIDQINSIYYLLLSKYIFTLLDLEADWRLTNGSSKNDSRMIQNDSWIF